MRHPRLVDSRKVWKVEPELATFRRRVHYVILEGGRSRSSRHKRACTERWQRMQAQVACVQRAEMNDARGPAHKSRTHRLLGPHKQAEGWNVLALSNGRWKLPDDQFGAFLEHYVSDLPRFNLGLVVKKSEYFPYIMDVDKSATKGASVGSPMEVLKVVVRALKSVVSFPDGEGSALRCAASGGLERSSKESGCCSSTERELSRAVP